MGLNIMEFKNPPREFSPVPFWFWNDDLKEDNLEWQMRQMLEQHVYEFFIHARKGLTIPYLSDKWFDKVGFVLDKARDLGLKVWVYDEDNWPSGYAGGRVLKENPDYCGKHLGMKRMTVKQYMNNCNFKQGDKLICALLPVGEGFDDITNNILHGTVGSLSENEEVFFFVQSYTRWHPAYSDDYYVDVLNRKATEAFIRHTHKEYKRRFQKYFGNVLKGFFTDEAGFYNNLKLIENMGDEDTIPWTDEFPSYFKKQNGYSIEYYLPYIWIDDKKYFRKIRSDLYQTLCSMYKENFLEPQRSFCENNGLRFVGHLHMEDYLHYQIITQGDMMRAQESLSYAGTDRIDLSHEKINEKFISSAGHIYNKKRVLSETYALSSWGLTLGEMKRWADWQYVRGINMLVPHAFYASIEGDRKWECPPSQFYQNPYWKYYKQFADYIRRMSYTLSMGVHVADIAVYYPLSTAYELLTPNQWEKVISLDKFLQQISFALLDNQYDFDFINDDGLIEGSTKDGAMCVSGEAYKILIIPWAINLTIEVLTVLREFSKAGGTVIFLKSIPDKCVSPEMQREYEDILKELLEGDGVHYIASKALAKPYTYCVDIGNIQEILNSVVKKDFCLQRKDPHIKYVHRRSGTQDIYLLINEDGQPRHNVAVFNSEGIPQQWDLETGDTKDLDNYRIRDGYTLVPVNLEPYGSMLVVFDKNMQPPAKICLKQDDTLTVILDIKGKWNLHIGETVFDTELLSWDQLGLPYFSGEGVYEKDFMVPEGTLGGRAILDLGHVADCSEVWLNGQYIGYRVWDPYQFDVTDHLEKGINRLTIKVVNTLKNELEHKPQESGLLGPVRVRIYMDTI